MEVEKLDNEFYSHKTGFSPKTLAKFFMTRGFKKYVMTSRNFEVHGYFFKQLPSEEQIRLLGLPPMGM